MALTPFTKHTYQFAAEPVHSNNLNELQDAVVELQNNWADPEVVAANTEAIENIGFHAIKTVIMAGITSLPKTFAAQGITADHKLIQEGSAYVSPRSSMANGWTLTSGNGTVTVSGTFSGSASTTIIATMGIPDSTVTGVAQ